MVPLESPSLAVVHEDGASPAPHMSFQWNWPPVAKRARAKPVISTFEPVSGAYQSGAAIAASGGMSPLSTAPTEVGRPLLIGRQRRVGRRVRYAGAFGVAGQYPLGGLLEQLARLVGAQRDAMVKTRAHHEPCGAGRLARVNRAGGPLHRDRALAAVLRRVGAPEECLHRGVGAEAHRLAAEAAQLLAFQPLFVFLAQAGRVGHRALDQHRMSVVGGVVVVAGVEVIAGEGLHDAVVIGVLRG